MKRSLPLLCITLAALAGPLCEAGSSGEFVGVKPRLISEVDSIVPGQTFTVALALEHEEPYHTYWVNPGMAGVATGLQWTLPEGFTAGEIQWQVPERTVMIIYGSHGYKGDALLLVDIKAPDRLPRGPILLKAKAYWMSCAQKTCCNVGFKDFELSLSTGKEITWNQAARTRIADARRRLPRPIPGWKYSATRTGDQLTLVARRTDGSALEDYTALYFYSEINYVNTLFEQNVEINGPEISIFIPLSEQAPDKIETVSGLLYNPAGWPGADGQNYMPISFPMDQGP